MVFGLFRTRRQVEENRRELHEAKIDVQVQRLRVLEALQELADAKKQRGRDDHD